MSGGDNRKNRAAYTREGRKQLFAVLQSARGSSGYFALLHSYALLISVSCLSLVDTLCICGSGNQT